MKPHAVLYATREGQTRRIAEHIAATLRARDHVVEVIDVRGLPRPLDLERFATAIVAASVHTGKHEPEMVAFVKRHREALEKMPTAFLSVSLSEATVEDPSRPAEARKKAADDVRGMIASFMNETGWHPKRVKAVAGALLYTEYNLIVRFVMKHIAKGSGGPTDTSRDYEYTDWQALDRFVDEIVAVTAAPPETTGESASRGPVPSPA